MLVRDLLFGKHCELLSSSQLWHRKLSGVSSLDIQVFIRSHWGTPYYHKAINEVDDLIESSWQHSIKSETKISPPSFVFFEPPSARMTIGELSERLCRTSVIRRKAILFGMVTGLSLSAIASLRWNDIRHLEIPEAGQRIIKSLTRHIKLDYVFWESLEHISMPLLDLENTVLDVSDGVGYRALVRLWRTAIPIDQNSDFKNFIMTVCDVVDKP